MPDVHPTLHLEIKLWCVNPWIKRVIAERCLLYLSTTHVEKTYIYAHISDMFSTKPN